jgi:hypothetical protein
MTRPLSRLLRSYEAQIRQLGKFQVVGSRMENLEWDAEVASVLEEVGESCGRNHMAEPISYRVVRIY